MTDTAASPPPPGNTGSQPASLLDSLIAAIQNKPLNNDGSLTLTPADLNSTFTNDWFTNVLQAQTITITSPQRTPGTNMLTVSGGTSIWSITLPLTVTIVFSADADGNVIIATTTTYDPAHAVPVVIMPWLQISAISIRANFSQPDEIVDFSYACMLQAPGHPGVPVVVSRTGPSSWQLDIAENTTQAVTANDLIATLGGSTLESFLPGALTGILAGIQVNGMQAIFDTQAKTVDFLQAGFTVTNGWDIAPPVIVLEPGLQINLTLINAADSANRLFAANVHAKFLLGSAPNQTEIPVYMGATIGAANTWTFGIEPGQSVTIPSFSDLLKLAGADFYSSLPAGLKDLPTIVFDRFEVNFDVTNKVLLEIAFDIQTGSNWPVLPGYFEINNFQIGFDITNVNVPASRMVTGMVYALFKFGDNLYLMCSIVKDASNPNWTITAGLPPGKTLNATQLVAGFFSGQACFPSNAPQIVFTTLNASVTPSIGVFQMNVGSTDPWTLFGNFTINGFNINLTRDAAKNITVSVVTQLIIANVPINLSASLSNDPTQGWHLQSGTQAGVQISVKNLVDYLVGTFGVSSPQNWISDKLSLQDLSIDFNTAPLTTHYEFDVTANIPMADKTFPITIHFAMDKQPSGGFIKNLSGTVTINNTQFTLDLTTSSTDTLLSATWQANDPSHYIQLQDIVSALGITLPGTDALDLSLSYIKLAYDFTASAFVLEITSASYGTAAFASYLDASSTRQYYFSLNVSSGVNLSNLPLVNKILPAGDTLQIEQMQAVISSTPVTTPAAIAALNNLLGPQAPQVPASGITQKVQFSMSFDLGGTKLPVCMGFGSSAPPGAQSVSSGTPTGTAPGQSAPPAQTASDGSFWFSAQRNFGPLSVSRVGLRYKSNVLYVLLDASLTMGGMNLSVMGLAVGMDIRNFTPAFNISGLGLDYSNGAVELGGAFMKLDPPQSPATLEFAGGLVVKTQRFSVAAFGDYANIPTGTSLFMFASVSAPFGGPPFFFITGFCGGFGYNSSLRLPGMNEVYQFPFVAGLNDPSQVGGPNASPLQVMEVITGQTGQPAWVTPQAGAMWAAIGIQFSTFSIINSTALLTAVFGDHFKLALIGLSKASFPMGSSTAYAYVELQLEAVFDPGDGVMSFTAVLSPNSYVIDPNCHLTGGFAMFFWYGSNPHAGDFVVSVGGYSPYFTPPSWYPQLPRLGFNWSLSGSVSITGGAYFALTPSALMAGGSLAVVYHSGNLRAWFTAYADIVIWWNPFHFIADIGVSVGASYKMNLLFTSVTLTVEMGADLTLWGPPTGGTATIHWWVISFTVDFGQSLSQGAQVQQWSDFHQVLPAPNDAVKFTATRGIAAPQKQTSQQQPPQARMMRAAAMNVTADTPAASDAPQHWLVRGDKFQFSTSAAVPVSHLYIGKANPTLAQQGNAVNIRPMQQTGLKSSHNVYLQLADGTEINMLDPQRTWSWSVNTKNVANALWGTGDCKTLSAGDNQLVQGQPTGMTFSAPPPVRGYSPGIATLQNLGQDPLPPGTNPLKTGQAASGPTPQQSDTTIAKITQIAQQQTTRTNLASALQTLGITVSNDNPANLGSAAGSLFADEPMLINNPGGTLMRASFLRSPQPMTATDPQTLLDYSLSTSQDPVQASVPGQTTLNTVDITISVSNGGVVPVTCSSITFSFNIGTLAQDLTNADNMHPVVYPAGQWAVASQGAGSGSYIATPVKPQYGTLTATGFSVTFPNVGVNTQVGTTPIIITEVTPAQSAICTLPLGKFPPGFIFNSFMAAPSTIAAGGSTTLSWNASPNATYTLTWGTQSQGVTNVRSYTVSGLFSNTVFYLKAVSTQGGQSVTRVLTFPVTVLGPQVGSFTASPNPANLGGQVTFSWSTSNADHCRLNPPMGTGILPATGSVTITPTLNNSQFTLSALDAQEKVFTLSQPLSIQFNPGTMDFRSISQMYPGGPVPLSWTLSSIASVYLSPGAGVVSGNLYMAYPQQTTTFVLMGVAAQGALSKRLQVAIVPLEQYLPGNTYSVTNGFNYMNPFVPYAPPSYAKQMVDTLTFAAGNSATYTWHYVSQVCNSGSIWTDQDITQSYPGTWSMSGGTLVLTSGSNVFNFSFNVPGNTFGLQNPPAVPLPITPNIFNPPLVRGNLGFTLQTPPVIIIGSDAGQSGNFNATRRKMLAAPPRPLALAASAPATPQVLLTYTVNAYPDPLQTSIPHCDPSTAVIVIGIANTGVTAVNCSSITINFNIGSGGGDLTTDDSTIVTVLNPSDKWTVAAQGGGQFEITPQKPANQQIDDDGFTLTLSNINVNAAPGATTVTITEKTSGQTATYTTALGKQYPDLTVQDFIATPQEVQVAASTTLSWQGSENATYSLAWGNNTEDVTHTSSYTAQNITADTIFYLTANGTANGQSATKTLTFPVTVLLPQVSTFTAGATTINLGDSATLSWTTVNTDHCKLSPAMGNGNLAASGSVTVVPDLQHNSFTLAAYDKGEIYDEPFSTPVAFTFNNASINGFSASPQQTYPGGYVTLSWSIVSAISPSISGIGAVSGNSFGLNVQQTTSFTLSCNGVQGPISSSPVTVNVIPLSEYLPGRTYTCTSDDGFDMQQVTLYTLQFTDASNMQLGIAYGSGILSPPDPSSSTYYPATWSVSGNMILVNYSNGNLTFAFDTVDNAMMYINPAPIGGGFGGGGTVIGSGGGGIGSEVELVAVAPESETAAQDLSPLLSYAVSTKPDTIQASVSASDPNTIKLLITVSGGDTAVTCNSILFGFNIGDLADDLTSSDTMNFAVIDAGGNSLGTQWAIGAQGDGQYKATPLKPQYGVFAGNSITFVFFDVNVNTVPGSTPLSITETTASGSSTRVADQTISLGKFPPSFSVSNFQANPSTISVGDGTLMSWNMSGNGVLTLTVNGADHDVSAVTSFAIPKLTETSTIYLKAVTTESGQTITNTLSFTVTVLPVSITTFSVNKSTINLGDSVTFSWTTANADHCVLLPALGSGGLLANGSTSVTPALNSDQFTLFAYDKSGQVFAQSAPIPIQFNNGVISSFTVDQAQMYPNGTVVLSWSIISALSPFISNIGNVSGNSVSFLVAQTTSFVLSCQAVQGTITQNLTVNVVSLAQYLAGKTYSMCNVVDTYYGGTPSGGVAATQTTYDTVTFTDASNVTYGWSYEDDDYDQMQTSTANQSYQGTWSADSNNVITLTTNSGVFQFQFNPASNTMTFLDPRDVTGTGPDGVGFIASSSWIRPNLTLTRK